MDDNKRAQAIGYGGIVLAVLIWAGWIVATRHAMLEARAPLDIALLRYGAPALLLIPVVMRKGLFPKGESPWRLAIMTAGWGGPFVLLVSEGMKTVEASLFGPLVPGLLPLVVALWEAGVARKRLRPGRVLGVVFIAVAVGLILIPAALQGDSGLLTGAPWLLCACLGWSAFTIAYRGCGLTGLEAAAYVCTYSMPFLIGAALFVGTGLLSFSWEEAAMQIVVQGVLSGMLAVALYGFAVKTLGLARASAFTCLVPVMAALGGWALLAETPGLADWAASGAACVGVLLVNRYAA